MATFAIGDLQGCYTVLLKLLDAINYDANQDYLLFSGDLINRGPESLACLNYVKDKVDAQKATTVLGNHDLYLLAAYHNIRKLKKTDTLGDILNAPNVNVLIDWLRRQPLIYFNKDTHFVLTHAGIYPKWDIATALKLSKEVQSFLKSDSYVELLKHMYGNTPCVWSEHLSGFARLRFIINAFTRMRFINKDGRLDFSCKSVLGTQPKGFFPWFDFLNASLKQHNIIFGHWAALYNDWDKITLNNIYPIDSGCVWGNALTAFCLENKKKYSVKSKDK